MEKHRQTKHTQAARYAQAGQAHSHARHTGRPGTQAGSAYRQARRTAHMQPMPGTHRQVRLIGRPDTHAG